MVKMGSKFSSEITVRPSDIDVNGHVHNSIYLDYVEQARFKQMGNNYHYPMERFWQQGLSWVVKSTQIDYLRPIRLQNRIQVITWVESWQQSDCIVSFEILLLESEKIAARGSFVFTLIQAKTGRPTPIPDNIVTAFSI